MTTHVNRSRLTTADPARQAFLLLRTAFTVAPIVFGLDKFANVLADWPQYLAPWIDDIVPGTAQQAMYAVGVVEVLAGVLVAVAPRIGGWMITAYTRRSHARLRRRSPSRRASRGCRRLPHAVRDPGQPHAPRDGA